MKKLLPVLCICLSIVSQAQTVDNDAFFIKSIYDYSLSQSKAYTWLETLCTQAGPRLSGSEASYNGLEYTMELLRNLDTDTVFKVECMVPRWHRGDLNLSLHTKDQTFSSLHYTMLGNSVGTDGKTLSGEVVAVNHLDSLAAFGSDLKDKIVYFNRPMDPTQVRTFQAYGGAVDQRVFGPSRSAAYGAKAVLVRSMASLIDTFPHTGVTVYEEDVTTKIPGIAISTYDAVMLDSILRVEPVFASLSSTSYAMPDTQSYNVVAEIRGSEYPDEIILVGGHIDAWDLGQGAHDDGAGCLHSIQVIEVLNALGYKPKRTIRCVMFINEENGLAGGEAYAKYSNQRNEFHLASIESDSGGFTPRGFSCNADEEVFVSMFANFKKYEELLSPYGLQLSSGGGGADINPLKSQKGLLIGLRPDSQRYFDLHHTANDRIENVHPREFLLGGAAITSLVYLIDQHGL